MHLAMLEHRRRKARTREFFARSSGQPAEGVIGVGNASVAVTAHDHIILRIEEAFGPLLVFAHFPVAVGGVIEPRLKVAQVLLHLADAGDQDAQCSACPAEQPGHPDRE